MSTRDLSANNSEYENPYKVLNGSELGLGSSATSMFSAQAQVVTKPSRTRSIELPRVSHGHDCLASGQLKDEKIQFMAKHITTLPRHSAPLMNHEQRQGVNYDINDIERISKRNSERSISTRDAFVHVQSQKVHSRAPAWEQSTCSNLTNRCEREET